MWGDFLLIKNYRFKKFKQKTNNKLYTMTFTSIIRDLAFEKEYEEPSKWFHPTNDTDDIFPYEYIGILAAYLYSWKKSIYWTNKNIW